MPRLVRTAPIRLSACQAQTPPSMCMKARPAPAPATPSARRAQHEHAAQEGQKANPADDGEHGAEQGVVIGAPATVTEAGGGRRAPGAEQALAACREPGGDAHHDQAGSRARSGSRARCRRRRARGSGPPRSATAASLPGRRRPGRAGSRRRRPASSGRDRGPGSAISAPRPGQFRPSVLSRPPGGAANIATGGVSRGMRTVVSLGASAMRMSPSERVAAPRPA